MTNDNTMAAALRPTTTIVTREGTELYGPRLVTDDAAALCVRAFPFSAIAAAIAAAGSLAVAGAYLLVGSEATYVGESGNIGRRLTEHAADPNKGFAHEVYVLSGFERRLDKAAAVHMQARLSEYVESSGVVRLLKGVSPCAADLPGWRKATLDRMLADALPLLFDAGCRCLTPAPRPILSAAAIEPAPDVASVVTAAEGDAEERDEGPMQIGVTTVPLGVEELELSFAGLWARGYAHQDQFVVAAGSEMRRLANASITDNTLARRQRLFDTETVVTIPGVDDRLRLKLAVAFPSKAIAAKVLCGAHVGTDKWRPLRASAAVILAA